MIVSKKTKKHIIITLEKTEYITIYFANKNERILIENRKDNIYINHFRNKPELQKK